jgi:hypothetical protein
MIVNPFKAGGSLIDEQAAIYIERQADRDALAHLQVMDYLLIVESRQQGKTSLINHLMRHPALENAAFAYVDVSTLDRSAEAMWYRTLCSRILRQLRDLLPHDKQPDIPTDSIGWRDFLRYVAVSATSAHRRVIIVLDEIGAVAFPNASEFFSVLRDVFSSRQAEPELKWLTFLLSGAFYPRDLIRDDRISPFNIAQRVRLADFTLAQVRELVGKAGWSDEQAALLAERIHQWTDGQPYLTQWLCSYLGPDATPADVDAGVERLRREDENHLPPLITRVVADAKLPEYVSRILFGEKIKFYPGENRRQAELELLGIVKADSDGSCQIRNRIYEQALVPESNWQLWENQITEALKRSGRVKQSELHPMPVSPSLWTTVVSKYKNTSALPIAVGTEEIYLEHGSQLVARWNRAWNMTREMLARANTLDQIEPFIEMTGILAEAAGLRWDYKWHTLGMLRATTITDHALPVNIPNGFPLIFTPSVDISADLLGALISLCQLTKVHQFFSILIPILPDEDSAKIAQLRELLRDSLYADDFVVLSPDELFYILAARNPAKQIAQCIGDQVSPSSISPFIVGDPVAGRMFFGRDQEIRDITLGLTSRSFSVIGNRRIGKSSLLRQIKQLLNQEQVYAATLLNLQAVHDLVGLYRYLEQEPHIQFHTTDATAEGFRSFVKHLTQRSSHQVTVLLIDEPDALLLYDENHNYLLSSIWRELSENGRCLFIFAGHRVLARMRRDARSPFYNFTDFLSLGCLEEPKAKQLISGPLAGLGIELSDAPVILSRVWEVSNGHPNVIQYIGNELLKGLDRGERVLRPNHLECVLSSDKFVDHYLDTVWGGSVPSEEQGVSPLERAILLSTDYAGGFTARDVARALAQHGYRVDALAIHDALNMLTAFKLLTRDGQVYTHTMPCLPAMLESIKQKDYWLGLLRDKVNQ